MTIIFADLSAAVDVYYDWIDYIAKENEVEDKGSDDENEGLAAAEDPIDE